MARLAWLIYRINTPALRFLFMAPGNKLRVRDGLISLLAGDLTPNRALVVPVLAFKTFYYVAAGMLRWGMIQPPQPMAEPTPAE